MEDKESISFEELFERYQALLTENSNLKKENGALKARLAVTDVRIPIKEIFRKVPELEMIAPQSTSEAFPSGISNRSDSSEKIRLFMSLFKGRDNVYAKRWESKQKEKSGYSPACLNEWRSGVCAKPKGACAGCNHKAYAVLDEKVIQDHLHIVQGYTINEQRFREQAEKLTEMRRTVELLARTLANQELVNETGQDVLRVITDYAYALTLLDRYDHGTLTIEGITRQALHIIGYEEAIGIVAAMKGEFEGLFGIEKDQGFKSAL